MISCYYCSIDCSINGDMLVDKFLFFSNWLVLLMRHNWLASLKNFWRLKVLLIQFFPVALSVICLLVYAKCNFAFVQLVFLSGHAKRWVSSSLQRTTNRNNIERRNQCAKWRASVQCRHAMGQVWLDKPKGIFVTSSRKCQVGVKWYEQIFGAFDIHVNDVKKFTFDKLKTLILKKLWIDFNLFVSVKMKYHLT